MTLATYDAIMSGVTVFQILSQFIKMLIDDKARVK